MKFDNKVRILMRLPNILTPKTSYFMGLILTTFEVSNLFGAGAGPCNKWLVPKTNTTTKASRSQSLLHSALKG